MNSPTHTRAYDEFTVNRRSPLALVTIFLALVAALSLAGCTGLTGAGTPGGNPDSADTGTLAASATNVTFGGVKIGVKSVQTLTLTNTGKTTVTISEASITGSGFSIVGGAAAIAIPAGQKKSIQVQFAPTSIGSATGSLAVASNASDSAVAISLSGNGMSALTITSEPQNESVISGQTATFSVTATGNGALTYQWQKNGAAIAGATAASYTTPATTTSDNGAQFTVVITDTNGSELSVAATLTVTAASVAPSITAQPASKTVTAGQTATFTVTATGTAPLTYTWKKNGTAISGAAVSSYTTPATVASDSGAQFTVTITNASGTVTSNAATLTVNVPPSITTQPANQTVNVGQTATFSVAATGTGPLTYQWSKNGTAISGATSSSYTTPATAATDSGALFTVTVTGIAGNVTSNSAKLTVNVPPSISAQPANQTVNAGKTATFSVAATGTATLTYQWKKNGTAVSGATASSYTTPATVASDNGALFTVTVTNSLGSVTSNAATLTVNVPPTITGQPANQTVTAGQTATFTVTATGTGTLTYQWKKSGTAIAGATLASYTTPATAAADNGSQFSVTITDIAGNVTSNTVTLTVNVPPSITTQPSNQSVTAGQTATFSVTAAGTGTLTYQWKKSGTAIAGATSASYTTPATATTDNGAVFTVTVTGTVGNVTSNGATLTVTAAAVAPSITTQPANQTVNLGQTATFSVTATGTATLTYQWKKNGTAISGATSASYTTPATAATDSGAQFTVTVTNNTGNATSSAATLTVNLPPTITAQPANKTVTAGQTATFSVTATGTGTLTYQWKKNGTAISGATSASYTTPAAAAADNGSLFTVTVTDTAGNATSSAATLTVNAPPTITTQPASKTVIAGQTATFSVTATGTGTLSYQWQKNGTAIGGATSASYTTPATATTDNGALFTVTVTNTTGTVTSSAATLTVNAATLILNANQTSLNFSSVNVGSTATLSVIFTNAGNSNVTISNVTITGAGFTASGVSSGQIVTPGNTATLSVKFAPAAGGAVTGASTTVTSNATTSPAVITLTGTGVAAVTHSVTLTWTASTSAVAGYNVYRSTVSGGPYTRVNSALVTTTSYTDSAVQSGLTYYYVVTSVTSGGVESVDSTEVSATIP